MPFSLPWSSRCEAPVQIEHLSSLDEVIVHPRTLGVLGVWTGEVNEQKWCRFLTDLPAEIRNQIYHYVFTPSQPTFRSIEEEFRRQEEGEGGQKNSQDSLEVNRSRAGVSIVRKDEQGKLVAVPGKPLLRTKPHPLSLLLTCRRISDEATVLAFNTHTFTATKTLPFHVLRQRVSLLNHIQVSGITALALLMDDSSLATNCVVTPADRNVCAFMTHAILLFPQLTSLVIRQKMHKWNNYYYARRLLEHGSMREHSEPFNGFPNWFVWSITLMTGGSSYPWQQGQKWEAQYPPFGTTDEPIIYKDGDLFPRDIYQVHNRTTDDLFVLLKQETGRRVKVYCQFEIADDARRAMPLVKLIPGQKSRLPLTKTGKEGHEGYMWDGDEEYWKGLKKHLQGGGIIPSPPDMQTMIQSIWPSSWPSTRA